MLAPLTLTCKRPPQAREDCPGNPFGISGSDHTTLPEGCPIYRFHSTQKSYPRSPICSTDLPL